MKTQLLIANLALSTLSFATDFSRLQGRPVSVAPVAKTCGIQKYDERLLAADLLTITQAKTGELDSKIYSLMFQGDAQVADQADKMGVSIVSQVGDIYTARATMCEVIAISGIEGMRRIVLGKKLQGF